MPRMQHENKPVLSSERKYSIIFVLSCSINTHNHLRHSMPIKTREKKNDINHMVYTYDCVLHISYDSLFSKSSNDLFKKQFDLFTI